MRSEGVQRRLTERRLPRIFLAVKPSPRVLFQGSGRMVFIVPTEIARIRAFLKVPATLRGYITLGPLM